MVSLITIFNFFEDYKSLVDKGEKAVNASDIQMFNYDPENKKIDAQVAASCKTKLYRVTISLDEAAIKTIFCECPKGNYKCHHMAAALIYASKNISCTDQPCKWSVVKQPTKTKSVEELFGTRKKKCLKLKPTEEDKKYLYSMLQKHAPNSGLIWFMSPEPSSSLLINKCIDQIVATSTFRNADNKVAYLLNKISITEEERHTIFEATAGQSKNPLWGSYKKGRITSSNFGAVIKAIDNNKIYPSLIKSLNGEYSCDGVKAIQWGICHESTAIKLFSEVKKKKVKTVGIYLHLSGLIGCSPDGLIDEDDILEVKCPFSKNESDILKDVNSKKWYLVFNKDVIHANLLQCGNIKIYDFQVGDIKFNLKHPLGWKYYNQIQGNLHLMNKKACHVFIWTPHTSLIFIVEKEASWAKNIPKLINFYKNVFIYNLIN